MNSDELSHIQGILAEALKAHLTGDDSYDIDINALELRINIKGGAWSGAVDKPIAKFILDLDKRLEDEVRSRGVALPRTEHGLIALEIKTGSTDALFKYAKGILNEWKKMKTRDKILIVTALLLALGIWKATDFMNALKAPELERIKSDEKIAIVKTVASLAESNRDLQQPIRSLIAKLDEKDTIHLPAAETHVSKAEAKEVLEKAIRTKPISQYVDGRYIVLDLKTRKPGEWQVTLKYGDVVFPAKLELNHDEVTSLLAEFTAAHKKGSDIAPDLQVTATINDKGIQTAIVVGLGAPREKAMKLSEALAFHKN